MTDEQKLAQALQKARAFVKYKAPYVAKTLYGLVPHAEPGLETLAVNERMVLLVDPVWFVKLSLEEQGACLFHEISHVVRGLERLNQFPDKELANIAFDLPINSDMRDAGWKLPHGYYPEVFDLPKGLTGEQYYELLAKNVQKSQSFAKKLAEMARGLGAGKCGGCAGNHVDKAKEDAASSQKDEEGNEIGRGAVDINHIRTVTAKDIRQSMSKGRGNIPQTLKQWLPEEQDPHRRIIRWEDELGHLVRRTSGKIRSGRADYSYRRFSRRSFMFGIVKPGMIARTPTIGFVEDTSGSMGEEQIRAGRTQAIQVFMQMGLEHAWWISADAAVAAAPKVLKLRDILKLPVIGRGGTDFRPAIEAAQKLRPRPDILMYLTDGDGTAPMEAPTGMEVVFLIVPSYYNKSPANWGHTIIMQDRIAT